MLVDAGSRQTTEDEDAKEKDLMTFCIQLINHSQWKFQREILCGSVADCPFAVFFCERLGIQKLEIDIDRMIHNTSRWVVNCTLAMPEIFCDTNIVTICKDGLHTGYVRLIREKDSKCLLLTDLHILTEHEERHGPAALKPYRILVLENNYTLSDLKIDIAECDKIKIGSRDTVYSVHYLYWPKEAMEWIHRKRLRGFPSKTVIKEIISYGCDFVQVPYSKLTNSNEWRFSFSKAEVYLANSWTTSQKLAYDVLWIINKKIASSNLCSYYFKTLMFWACEKNETEFWNENYMVSPVCDLLNEMIIMIKSKFCANYFIPDNNMMDHLKDVDLSREIETLRDYARSSMLLSDFIPLCKQYEDDTIRSIICPAWMKRSFLIYNRVNNNDDNYKDLFSTDIPPDFQKSLYLELSDIYKGLCCHRKCISSAVVSLRLSYFRKSENHLCTNLHESQQIDVIRNCTVQFVHTFANTFIYNGGTEVCLYSSSSCDSVDDIGKGNYFKVGELNVSFKSRIQKSGYSEKQDCIDHIYIEWPDQSLNLTIAIDVGKTNRANLYNPTQSRPTTFVVLDVSKELIPVLNESQPFVKIHCADQSYEYWPGRSPTVNISWFIAMAYRANLYYTTQQCDVSLAIATCNEIIDVYRKSQMNEAFAERSFPVVLSTEWTSIYDKEIQKLLGFYSLCSYVLDLRSRSVYLGVCPVQFALYLKVRIGITHENREVTLEQDINDYIDHAKVCLCDKRVINGTPMIMSAIKSVNVN